MVKALLMGIATGIMANRVDGSLTAGIKDKIENCYDAAEKDFYRKYSDSYGDHLSSFLVRQANRDVVEKSFNYSYKPLSDEDFNLKSFDGFENPSKEAVIDFINIFRTKVLEDFDLSRLLMEKEHIHESKIVMSNIENIKEKMVRKNEFEEGNKKVLHGIEQIMRLMQQSNEATNIELKESKLFSSDIKEMLVENSIDISEKSITSIINSDGKITGELIVKYNDFLSSFKSFQELLNYSYYTQTVIELEPIAFKLKFEDKVIKELVYDKKYTGQVAKVNFTSYGEIKFIAENFKNVDKTKDIVSKLQIHPPQNIEDILKVNIESEDYDTILPNIELRVQSRKILQDDHLIASFSNEGQKDSDIFIRFDVKMKQGEVINTDIKIKPMDQKSALNNLKWLKTIRSMKQVRSIIARDCLDDRILFEGKINLNDNDTQIEEGIDFMKKILFIEKEIRTSLDIPDAVHNEDIEDVENLVSILKTGKIDMPDFTMTSKHEAGTDYNKLEQNKIYMFQFLTTDKYRIFGTELDLGEQVILLEKAKLKEIKENGFILETEKESKKIRIYTKYYGKYLLDEIKEKEVF